MDVGAVYLYDGGTLALISTLTGGTASDQVSDFVNVKVLANSNFVVFSQSWDDPNGAADVGAVTFCSGTTGCNGVVSAANSLIGTTTGDIGGAIITPLPNGNYVVTSRLWDNPSPAASDAGASTFCNGTSGCTGAISSANSLVGSSPSDQVGGFITVLSNGNYVVRTGVWNNPAGSLVDAGAATFCLGTSGPTGPVSASNSLVGNKTNDGVSGSGVFALTNGKYVVSSSNWDNPAPVTLNVGAVTLCSATGCTGAVTATNSLIGSTAGDGVGQTVIALTNGNFVVGSRLWDNPATMIQDVGAITFCSGATGCPSTIVSPSNSLVGSTAGDLVPDPTDGIIALTNGNYVVRSSGWDNPSLPAGNDAGAVTWGNGNGGPVGPISSANSLIGGTAGDNVGGSAVTALTNGHYVVASRNWDNPSGPILNAGAATRGNGAGGTVGLITAANSLVGGTDSDQIGQNGVTALTNGNYVVASQSWHDPLQVGAATFCNGATGCTGLVTPANSLVGSALLDEVGLGGVTALANGNYVVESFSWNNNAGNSADFGATTWGNGTTGTTGIVSASNSLIGSTASDQVGRSAVIAFSTGNYAVASLFWDNVGIGNAGAVTFGNGTIGTAGAVTAANSVLGTVGAGISSPPVFGVSYDSGRNRLLVGRSASNAVSLFTPPPTQLLSAVSRKTHGMAGAFDINLPLVAPFGVECRSGAGNHTLVFSFTNPITSGNASVTAGIGSVSGSPALNSNVMTVNLTGVADVQLVTVTLSGLTDSFGQAVPDIAVSVNMLVGDTSGNKAVNASDIAQTKAQSGAALTVTNFRTDINANGGINASDISLAKANAGHTIP